MPIKKLMLAGVATLAVTGGMFVGTTAAHAAPAAQADACVVTYQWSHAPQTLTYHLVVDQPYEAAIPELSHAEWQWQRTVEVPAATHVETQYRKVIAHDALTHTESQYRKVIAHAAVTHTETATTATDASPAGEGWQLVGTDTVPGTPGTFHTAWRWTRYVVTQKAQPAYDEVITRAWDEQVEHPAVTHTVHHDAVYTTVHHPAEYTESTEIKWVQKGGNGVQWLPEGHEPTSGRWNRTGDTRTDRVETKAAWDEQVLVTGAWDETVVDTPAFIETIHHPAVVKHHNAVPEQGHWVVSGYRTTAPQHGAGWTRTDDAIQVSNNDAVPATQTYTWQRTVVDKAAWNTIDFGYFAQDPGGDWEATGKVRTIVDKPAWNTIDFGYFAQDPGGDWEATGKTRTIVDTPASTTTQTSGYSPLAPDGDGWETLGEPVIVIDQPARPAVAAISHWATEDGVEVQPTADWVLDGDTATVTIDHADQRAAGTPGLGWERVAGSAQQTGDCDTDTPDAQGGGEDPGANDTVAQDPGANDPAPTQGGAAEATAPHSAASKAHRAGATPRDDHAQASVQSGPVSAGRAKTAGAATTHAAAYRRATAPAESAQADTSRVDTSQAGASEAGASEAGTQAGQTTRSTTAEQTNSAERLPVTQTSARASETIVSLLVGIALILAGALIVWGGRRRRNR